MAYSTTSGSAAYRMPPGRACLLIALSLGTILSGCRSSATEKPGGVAGERSLKQERVDFEKQEIELSPAKRLVVLTGFLLGDAIADLAVIHVAEDGDRSLRVYSSTAAKWAPEVSATLSASVLFVDVANIDGRDRLITYEPGRLNWFDPSTSAEHELAAVSCNFVPPRKNEIPHVDISQDVNGDGREDLLIPDDGGFWVFVQTENGAFADPIKIGRTPDMAGIYGADGYRYDPWSQSRIHEIDYDRNGRNDLVFWNKDHFEAHTQDEQGLFAKEPRTFTSKVAFDSDDPLSLAQGDMTGRVLHSMSDLNGDKIADLVLVSLQGDSISKKRSKYEAHLGTATSDGGIEFAETADLAFESNGRIQLGMRRDDFDLDGNIELMFTSIDVDNLQGNLWKTLKGMMGEDIRLDIEFYRKEEGRYSEAPSTVRTIALDGVPSHREPGAMPLDMALRGAKHESRKTQEIWPRAFNSTLLIGDVTGDGLSDLLISQHPRTLNIFVGVPGQGLFAQRSQDIRIAMPNDEEYTWLVDLNKDGKKDLVMHHPFTLRDGHGAPTQKPGSEPHRVTLLIAR